MSVSHADFTDALFAPDITPPAALRNSTGGPAGKRFDVYRNNVVVGLTDALASTFPVVHKLLGDHNFRVMARAYIRSRPAATPLMMHYGQGLPAFLPGFEPVATLGYLPDIARLELALRRSYHAADATPVDAARLAALPAERLLAARLTLAPAVVVVTSDWPIHAIWQFNMTPGAQKPEMAAEAVLITRPEFDPAPCLLPPGGAAFLQALQSGKTLSQAMDIAGETDLAAILGLLLAGGAITEIDEGTDK